MKKVVVISCLLFSSASFAVSFDCSKAQSKTEKLVCGSPSLSQADDELYADYLQAKKITGNSDEFKKTVRENRKLRLQNCDTEACQLEWYKKSSVLFRNIADSKNPASAQICYKDGQQVTLTGTLKRVVFPGPPNYESVEEGDEPEPYWVLFTKAPLTCIKDSPDWGSNDQFQLIVRGDFYSKNQHYLNQQVSVTGEMFYAETGHHHTPVLIDVTAIKGVKVISPSDNH